MLIALAGFDSPGGHMDGPDGTIPLHLTDEELRVVFLACNTMAEGAQQNLAVNPPGRETRAIVEERIKLARGIARAIEETGRVRL